MIYPVIELPSIRQEGFEAMARGMSYHSAPEYHHGFCFVPYRIGTTERANFLMGCVMAVFGSQPATGTKK